MITGRIPVVEWLVPKPVSKRVHAERSLLNKEDAEDAGVDESTKVVSPTNSSKQGREAQTHEQEYLNVISMLPDDNRVFVEI